MRIVLSDERYEQIKRIVVDLFVKYDVNCVPVNGFELAIKMGVSQLRVFGADRLPKYDIDYGVHQAKKFLHVHYFEDGNRTGKTVALHPGDALYEKYKRLFKGVS